MIFKSGGINVNKSETPAALTILFGATGDLAKRKLYPSLYRLYRKGHLASGFAVIGTARREWDNDIFREHVKKSVIELTTDQDQIDEFISHFYYLPHDVSDSNSYIELRTLANELDHQYSLGGNRLFYLAMAPEFFGTIADHLKYDNLTDTEGFGRLVIEKPFGHDLPSAQELNAQIRRSFDEKDIYRIDHYLGKEMVQNIESIRFANALFEPLWNNRYISNIQITSSETLGVEERGGYYETSGALKDMVQNHMLQMVSLLAMEPPISLQDDDIRSEKVRAFRSMRPLTLETVNEYFVRGQYGPSENGNMLGYREELNVNPESNTETYVAGKVMFDNFRWAGVPFYIRTGKRMPLKSTKIVVQFKNIPMNLYYRSNEQELEPNLLVIHIQPEEGITLHLNAKRAGHQLQTNPVKLSYANSGTDIMNTPEAYEKLIHDAMRGDSTNFTHWDEVALSWSFVDVIAEAWRNEKAPYPNYPASTTGPKAADELLEQDGFFWWPLDMLDVDVCN
ncbi:glucose-6-phosphate dehydrogenase [Domibacillus mangrovi]|uniref:Glucose-6-phosphate 1-dehydrogenase n=1 Tax=Domibacillus mangrovi TaxID=1714354 RepID=A0A1Q5P720_9BACI|nr:glucose-6-phosphate dehydrogenase [Domibacillus mangrovi]